MTQDTSIEAVERLAKGFDERVEMHSKLISGPCGGLRTDRGMEAAKTHSATAATLRALAAERDTLANQVEDCARTCSDQAEKIRALTGQLAEARNAALDEAANLMRTATENCRKEFTYPPKTQDQRDYQTGAILHSNAAKAICTLKSKPAPRKDCPECSGSGMRDSGGVQPWGEHIDVPCDCGNAPRPDALTALQAENARLREALRNIRCMSQKGSKSTGLRMQSMDLIARAALEASK